MPKDVSLKHIGAYIFCPHCATKNPRQAYVCLNCFKVMFPKKHRSWWYMQIPTSVTVTVIFAAVVFAVLYLGNRWINNVEANMSLHIKTNDYNVNVTADKRKNEDLSKELNIQHLKEEPVAAQNEE